MRVYPDLLIPFKMDQRQTVRKILNSIHEECYEPLTRHQWMVIRKHLMYCYAVGYDQGWRQQAGHPKPILQLRDGKVVKRYCSAVEAAKKMGVDKSSISKCAVGRTAHCRGFQWQYE